MVVNFDMPKFHTACEKVVPIHELHSLPAVEPKHNETLSIACITELVRNSVTSRY